MDLCETTIVLKILLILKSLINIVKIVIPLILIVIIIIDVTKNILDPDKQKKVLEISIKRFISAIIIFFVPTIVSAIFNIFGNNSLLFSCFNNANKEYIAEVIEKEKLLRDKTEKELIEEYEKQVKEIEEERKQQEEELKKSQEEVFTGQILTNIEMIDSKYPPKEYNKNITVNYYKGKKGFSYWMYVPDKVTTNLPVIIYLHGYGTSQGNDYYLSNYKKGNALYNGPIRDAIKFGVSYNAIVLQPQVPKDDTVYGYISSYVQLINRISEIYKINTRKISVMGLSHGCYGVGQFVTDYPNLLSAVVPMGCNLLICDEHKFVSTPMWAFSGSGEGVRQMPKFRDKVNAIGGNAKFDYCTGKPHNLLRDDYSILRDSQYNVIDWMLSQTRSN